MKRTISDEQLDRTFARYLDERGDEIAARARGGAQAAARVMPGRTRHAGVHRRDTVVLLAALITAALAASAIIVGSQTPRPIVPAVVPADRGLFTPTGSMTQARENPTATLLKDGRVLVVGGYDASSVEIWDRDTGVFSPAGELSQERPGHTATLLLDGRVLVVGGKGPGGDDLGSAEVWDPGTMTFTPTGSLAVARSEMTAELLPDGRVLVGPRQSAEVWDPDTNTFSPAGSLADGRYFGDGIVLSDGRLFSVDGRSASLRDPVTESSHPAGLLAKARSMFTATRLLDDRVLVAGGGACLEGTKTADVGQTASACTVAKLGTAELWDPATNSFSPTGPMTTPRARHAATLLLDGRVLLVGDWIGGNGRSAELFQLK